MEQHPVPQQISSYEFRLVGDMTLKQFFQVAGGCVVALIFYASHLPFYLKWPAVLVSAFTGIAMAFLPFEERPLQVWIFSFFKAVYSPTQFVWQKKPKKPEFLEERLIRQSAKTETVVSLPDRQKLTEYLQSLPTPQGPLDQREEGFLKKISELFSSSSLPPEIPIEKKPLETAEQPAGIRIRRLSQPPVYIEKKEEIPSRVIEEIPQVEPLLKYRPMPPIFKPEKREKPTKTAEPAPESLFPSIPSIPNILVGIVRDREGKLIEGAIVEIRDEEGNPVRALKTNSLGQFRIATPLPNGNYEIETEKEGLIFDIIKITLEGEIVQPIEIRARE